MADQLSLENFSLASININQFDVVSMKYLLILYIYSCIYSCDIKGKWLLLNFGQLS
jgi:hypothetical protein